jgi:hypothetical protein
MIGWRISGNEVCRYPAGNIAQASNWFAMSATFIDDYNIMKKLLSKKIKL